MREVYANLILLGNKYKILSDFKIVIKFVITESVKHDFDNKRMNRGYYMVILD